MSEMDLLDRLLGHDFGTTRQLLEIASKLADEQLDQEFEMGHRTVRRTFEHIIWNIECWTDLMRRNGVRPRPIPHQPVPALIQRHEETSAILLQFANELVEQNRLNDHYFDTLDDPPTEKTFGGTLVHLATHGMHHRAQLLFMLRRLGVNDLPEGDALSWERLARELPGKDRVMAKGSAHPSPPAGEAPCSDDQLMNMVSDLEAKLWNAVIDKDRTALIELLADNYIEITLDGRRLEKTEIVERSPQVDEIEGFTIDSEKVLRSGETSVVLNYHLQLAGKTSGEIITLRDRWATSIWT